MRKPLTYLAYYGNSGPESPPQTQSPRGHADECCRRGNVCGALGDTPSCLLTHEYRTVRHGLAGQARSAITVPGQRISSSMMRSAKCLAVRPFRSTRPERSIASATTIGDWHAGWIRPRS